MADSSRLPRAVEVVTRGLLATLALCVSSQAAVAQQTPLSSLVRLGRPLVSIGEESEEGPALFGHIRAAALANDGRIYVLDQGDNTIRIFGANGRFIGMAARRGRGPGDLAFPHAMYLDSDSAMFVADQITGVSVFHATPGGLEFQRSFGVELFPRSICRSIGRVVVGGYLDSKMLHVVEPDGRVSSAFGDAFNHDTLLAVRELANRTPVLLGCNPSDGRIVIAQNAGAGVAAHSPDGRPLWSISLPDYEGNFYFRDRRGALTTGYGSDYTESLHWISDSTLLVQVQRLRRLPGGSGPGRRAAFDIVRVRSYVVHAAHGRILARGDNLPLILAMNGDRAVVKPLSEFPRIELRAIFR